MTLGKHVAGVAHELLQHTELGCSERNLLLVHEEAAPGGVEPQISDHNDGRALAGSAPNQCPQPRHQNNERERFGEEVIGACVQRLGLVVLTGLGGQHENWDPHAALAQLGTDDVAVDLRQQDVEHDDVVRLGGGHPQALLPVVGDVDRISLALEAPLDVGGELRLILDNQYAHVISRCLGNTQPVVAALINSTVSDHRPPSRLNAT